MLFNTGHLAAVTLTLFPFLHDASAAPPKFPILERGIPAPVHGVTTIKAPSGAQIRYKEPGKAGVCETTPGVNSYSGYIDLDANTHMFFWFFEARHNPADAPLTLWLNGGPGSDSLIGLFEELGPCMIAENLTSYLNPSSWNEVSNMLFLSQPVGVGFSYAHEEVGSIDPNTGFVVNASVATPDGRYSVINPYKTDTTDLAAIATWHILQGFLANLPQLDGLVKPKKFNLWTESYGGHYGPSFFNYFYDQNQAIENGTANGTSLNFDTLGIGNGIINELIQAPYYPEFAVHNTYGIKAVNDTIYNFMKMAYSIPGGCSDYIQYCAASDLTTPDGLSTCAQATAICRNLVEGPYYDYSGRGVYDIRHPYHDPTPPSYFIDYLNTAAVQQAVGVNLNYTSDSSIYVGTGFDYTGDFVYQEFLTDLEMIIANGVRVALYYGDADYICNWFGGQAISLALNFTHKAEFAAAGYAPFMVDGKEYGEVRQYGNFSFLRMYESGHEVPFYQPEASLAMFRRVLDNKVLADGSELVTPTYSTNGTATATHTEPFVPLPPTSTASASAVVPRAAKGKKFVQRSRKLGAERR
ncbi:hypothetical protein MMC13_003514 [Lambiella insularis]|nr:hypothetical protein [Lambiella insularis]